MKKLVLLTTFIISIQLGFAQHVDLVVSGLHVTSDTNHLIPAGVVSSAAITIRNIDSSIVEMGDTIDFSMGINGTIFNGSHVLTTPLNPGEEIYHNFGDSNLYTFPDSVFTVLLYGAVMYSNDTMNSNDLLIDTFQTAVFVNNNWSTDSVEVINPSNLDGFDIDNGTNIPPNISEAQITFRNDGDVTYLQYSQFRYQISLGSISNEVTAILSSSDVGPNELNVRNLTNQALFPSIPDSVGTYSLCAEVLEPLSGGQAGCFEFTIVDNWDPNDPDNWPHGLSTVSRNNYDFINTIDQISFRNVTEALELSLYDVSGTRLADYGINSDSQISTNSLSTGIYFLEVRANGKVVGQEKFVRF